MIIHLYTFLLNEVYDFSLLYKLCFAGFFLLLFAVWMVGFTPFMTARLKVETRVWVPLSIVCAYLLTCRRIIFIHKYIFNSSSRFVSLFFLHFSLHSIENKYTDKSLQRIASFEINETQRVIMSMCSMCSMCLVGWLVSLLCFCLFICMYVSVH